MYPPLHKGIDRIIGGPLVRQLLILSRSVIARAHTNVIPPNKLNAPPSSTSPSANQRTNKRMNEQQRRKYHPSSAYPATTAAINPSIDHFIGRPSTSHRRLPPRYRSSSLLPRPFPPLHSPSSYQHIIIAECAEEAKERETRRRRRRERKRKRTNKRTKQPTNDCLTGKFGSPSVTSSVRPFVCSLAGSPVRRS